VKRRRAILLLRPPTIQQPEDTGHEDRQRDLREDAMRPSAAERDRRRVRSVDQHVEIRNVGRNHQRRGAETRAALESCLTERCADQRVTHVIHE
jgi:hypothetical protein